MEVSLPRLCVQNFVTLSIKPASPHTSDPKTLGQSQVQISIVSNSRLLREALILLLQSYGSIDTVQGETDGVDFAAANYPNHLVLLDGGIGHNAVVAHIQEWRLRQPSVYVIVIELKNDSDLILDCIEAGTHGYALQGASSAEVAQVIEQVYQGSAQCSPEITAKLFERLAQSKTEQPSLAKPALTRRELEVLYYLAKSCSDREIATELVIEVRTVKHHVHNILQKLKVKHRRDAAQLALNNRWLNLASP